MRRAVAGGTAGGVPSIRRRVLPVALGYALAGALVLGLGFWVAGRESGAPAAPEAWALVIYDPPSGVVVDHPLTLLFQTAAPLRLDRQGWVAGQLHLHALLDGVEVMPGAADVEAIGVGRFRWRLARPAAGAVRIQLVWAGPDHGVVAAGASAPITIEVR